MNDHDLIISLGGTSKVAKICGIRPQAVSQWKKNGIPRSVKNLLILCKDKGFLRVEHDAS
jgi:transcriptional regulator with XRE-family HTH domain